MCVRLGMCVTIWFNSVPQFIAIECGYAFDHYAANAGLAFPYGITSDGYIQSPFY